MLHMTTLKSMDDSPEFFYVYYILMLRNLEMSIIIFKNDIHEHVTC